MVVQNNTVVALRYLMKDDRGEILENRMDGPPVEYVHGSNSILPSLEKSLEGLTIGTEKTLILHDKQLRSPLHFFIVIDSIRLAAPDEVSSGKPKKDCGPDCCC